ncbi:uroporphyrinogen decarboxylase [Candidatus Pelagibacter communis]|uniref:uroporphyrinogen decarboxylase n=1 Tax=Pelagibacter ubique TaxID=198252 RepID=UPI00094DCBA6|nr:uroporphyrinogen decarboxylase [Candidatus Pelagibacter ubique]
MSNLNKILLNKTNCKSIWFMRQAGRYLPEFKKIRSKNQDFIKLCLNSELSSEITLQPIKRFDLDSAIIFSDILMVPYALGQDVRFTKGFGPKLGDFNLNEFLKIEENDFSNKLSPIYKAIDITRKKLTKSKSLISFIGAPWTLIFYMLNLKKSQGELNLLKLHDKKLLNQIIEILINFLCIHIKNQINAGADVIQVFDSWAGLIPKENLSEYCFMPNEKILNFCRKQKIPTICFPKGIKEKYEDFNKIVKPDGINIDPEIDPVWAREKLKNVVIQGGLNPNILLKADEDIIRGATKYIQTFKGIPYVFNLGHGLLPETDPDKVSRLIKFYRKFNG